ncbi:MAG: allophanate hydrolase subunit 1 [Desulfobacterales bacterium]|jgi:KipI family sensor histidine kinase inhibitor
MVTYRIAGDQFLIVKFGEVFSLKTNFTVITLCERLRKLNIGGIRGVSTSVNAMMIHYDPFTITQDDLKSHIQRLTSMGDPEKEILRSRLFRIPVVYGDRWTQDCAADFNVSPNLDFVAALNEMSVPELIEMHQSCTHWVAYIGFLPGLASFVPIDPEKRISAHKYDIPRTRTPQGTLGIGGILQCIYPMDSPGGYQMLGRTPLPIYDLNRCNPIFAADIVLFRPGDRISFYAISHEEFTAIEDDIGRYEYDITVEDWTINDFPPEAEGQHV